MIDAEAVQDFALFSQIKALPEMERRIVEVIVTRLTDGLREYGRWDSHKHDGIKDIMEEQADTAVYSVGKMLELMDEEQKGTK